MESLQLTDEDCLVVAIEDALEAARDEGNHMVALSLAEVLSKVRMTSTEHQLCGQARLPHSVGLTLSNTKH